MSIRAGFNVYLKFQKFESPINCLKQSVKKVTPARKFKKLFVILLWFKQAG